jgi:hypothetical protein
MDRDQPDAPGSHLSLSEDEIRYFAGLVESNLGRRVVVVSSGDSWPVLDQEQPRLN